MDELLQLWEAGVLRVRHLQAELISIVAICRGMPQGARWQHRSIGNLYHEGAMNRPCLMNDGHLHRAAATRVS